jgi:hypothetical protein
MKSKKSKKKCIVGNCKNTSDLRTFVGDLCAPCYEFVTCGEGRYSQAYRNSLQIVFSELARRMADGLVQACDPTFLEMRGSSISDKELAKLVRTARS